VADQPLGGIRRELSALLLLAVTLVTAALADDGRMEIVILAGENTRPFSHSPAWPELLADAHPEWRVVANVDDKRTLADLPGNLDAALAAAERPDAVLLFFGTLEADAKQFAAHDAATLQTQMKNALAALAAHSKTKGARLVVITPVPVVEARLDKWSKERFTNGEANSKAVAAAFRQAAADAGAALVDLHAWMYADVEADKPGRLVGSLGWKLRDWGHPPVAKWLDAELVKLKLAPRDPAAFARWQQQHAAAEKLNEILAATGEGQPAVSPVISSAHPLFTP
jgi:hypothetical protein